MNTQNNDQKELNKNARLALLYKGLLWSILVLPGISTCTPNTEARIILPVNQANDAPALPKP